MAAIVVVMIIFLCCTSAILTENCLVLDVFSHKEPKASTRDSRLFRRHGNKAQQVALEIKFIDGASVENGRFTYIGKDIEGIEGSVGD